MSKIFLSTNGCDVGKLNTKKLERYFLSNHLSLTQDPALADTLIFYACGLTQEREKGSLDIISELMKRKKEGSTLFVWGCLPKINPSSLQALYSGPMIGTQEADFFRQLMEDEMVPLPSIEGGMGSGEFFSLAESGLYNTSLLDPVTKLLYYTKKFLDMALSLHREKEQVYYIPIGSGCLGNCSYCSEKQVFGSLQSERMDKVVAEFQRGLEKGFRYFSFIATDVGSYGRDINTDLIQLLNAILTKFPISDFRIILNQIEPQSLFALYQQMGTILASGKIFKLDCPVQSGSDRILKMMGRKYTAKEWRDTMISITTQYPCVKTSTQFMVGFPSETEQDFQETLNLMKYPLRLDAIYIFMYSDRPTVRATKYPNQVPDEVKKYRYKKLLRKFSILHPFNYTRRRLRRCK